MKEYHRYLILGIILFAIILSAISSACFIHAKSPQVDNTEVQLRKYPYPYRTAFTIASDTHNPSVETFTAGHKLINTKEYISKDSEIWGLLFVDPEIEKREAWRSGIQGFGFPMADSMYLYNSSISVFKTFDEKSGVPVPHAHNGRDLEEIVDGWLRLGWIDTLHTPGPGPIPRKATAMGLEWLRDRPHGRIKVWTNHSIANTPTCVGPDQPALALAINNIIKCGTALMSWIGMESLTRKIVNNPFPSPLPEGQVFLIWFLSICFVICIIGFIGCIILKKFRKWRYLITFTFVAALLAVILQMIPLHFAQGDNPESLYYHADLVRDLGIRYYWLIYPLPNYETHILGTLVLPERACGGRSSILRVVTLDDDSKILTFARCYKGEGGFRSLELVTEQALEELIKNTGTCIIYTHWTAKPGEIFTAQALDALTQLQRLYEEGQIWIAPTSEILHHTFIRAYLEYSVHSESDKLVLDIQCVNDPTGENFVPTIDDLRGISFDCPSDGAIEVRLAGIPVDMSLLRKEPYSQGMTVYFPLKHPPPELP